MCNSKQQRPRRLDLAKVPQRVHSNIGFLHQIFDVLRSGGKFAQIAVQRRPMAEDLIQEPIMSLIGHGERGNSRAEPPDAKSTPARGCIAALEGAWQRY